MIYSDSLSFSLGLSPASSYLLLQWFLIVEKIANKLMKDLYVDNLITGTNSQDAELQMYEQGQQTLRNSFKKEDRFDGKEMKVLDTIWNMDDNCIYAPVKESYEPEVSAKRQILTH